MSEKGKYIVSVLLILYVILPDPIPRPIDDIILCVLYALNAKDSSRNNALLDSLHHVNNRFSI